MSLKIFSIDKSPQRVLYVLEKKQEFIKEFRKFGKDLDENITHNVEFDYFGMKDKDPASDEYSDDIDINEMFRIIKPYNIIYIYNTNEQKKESITIMKQRHVPKGDVLHAILCRDNYLQLVTRDNHFNKLRDITIPKTPEELI